MVEGTVSVIAGWRRVIFLKRFGRRQKEIDVRRKGSVTLGPRWDGAENQCTKELCAGVTVRALMPHQLDAKSHRWNRHRHGDERHLAKKRGRHTAGHARDPICVRGNGRGCRKARYRNRDVAMEAVRREELLDDPMTDPRIAKRQEDVDVPERIELLLRHPPPHVGVTFSHDEDTLFLVELAGVRVGTRTVRRRNRDVDLT